MMGDAVQQVARRLTIIVVCALSAWGLRLLPDTGYWRPGYELCWLAASLGLYLWFKYEGNPLSSYARTLALIFGLTFVFVVLT